MGTLILPIRPLLLDDAVRRLVDRFGKPDKSQLPAHQKSQEVGLARLQYHHENHIEHAHPKQRLQHPPDVTEEKSRAASARRAIRAMISIRRKYWRKALDARRERKSGRQIARYSSKRAPCCNIKAGCRGTINAMNRPQHRARKRFGQNFLQDAAVIDRIAAAIHPRSDQHLVEIGPGQGALTESAGEQRLRAGCDRTGPRPGAGIAGRFQPQARLQAAQRRCAEVSISPRCLRAPQ